MTARGPHDKPAPIGPVTDSNDTPLLRSRAERLLRDVQTGRIFAFEWDPVSDVVVIPRERAHALGINVEAKLTGKQLLSRVHPDDRDILMIALAGLVPENPTFNANFRILDSDRGVIRVESTCCALFDESGRKRRVTGIVTDVTAGELAKQEHVNIVERLHMAMDAGKTVGWDWDVKTGTDCWFGDLQTIFGIPTKTYFGHVEDFRRRVHPNDRALVWQAVKDAMENQTPYVAEFRIIREDGSICWVAAQGKFYYLSNGEAERMMGIAVDITDRKIAEENLHQRDLELAIAQRLAQVGSWQWNPAGDTVVWSDELYRIAGLDTDSAAPSFEEHSRLYTSESWELLCGAVEAALRTGTPYELVLEMLRPDGGTRWVIGRGETQRDATGRIVKLHGTVQDVTERRHSQEALRESEERLRLAAQAGRMYAYEWDRKTDVIVRSAEFTHILGVKGDSKNTTCQQMLKTVHPDDREKILTAADACTPENPTCRVRYRVIRPDGSVVWLEKNALAFFDTKGTILRMIGMVADITERKLAEEAISGINRRLIEAQEAERARIARDLHDDIAQRLAMLSVTLDQTKRIASQSDSVFANRIDELRNQVQDISTEVYALSHELHSSKLRHMDMVHAMRGFCMELSEQQNVDINFGHKDIPGSVPPEISICLFRVLQEALHNAVKHSKVRLFDVEARGTSDAILLTIRDAGLGFDPENAMKGPGLGLTSMQERLNLVYGQLSIHSEPSHGTSVHARVPFDQTGIPVRTAV
jgi:PAS domain S-box-containing protein